MRDFNNFNSNTKKPDDKAMGTLKAFAQKYEGASEEQIISQILIEAQKGRENGTLTDADIDRFRNMLYPMLNKSQREKLDKVVKTLKSH